MSRVIVVSGTPGTGKTTYAKKLAKEKGYEYVDVSLLIKKEKLHAGYDRKFKTYLVDIPRLNKYLINYLAHTSAKGVVIDSHLSHYLPKKYVSECIITKTPIRKLKNRLKKRGYSEKKIQENVDAENFDVCFIESKELGHKVKVITT